MYDRPRGCAAGLERSFRLPDGQGVSLEIAGSKTPGPIVQPDSHGPQREPASYDKIQIVIPINVDGFDGQPARFLGENTEWSRVRIAAQVEIDSIGVTFAGMARANPAREIGDVIAI